MKIDEADLRGQYRISCGVDVVIAHVLPYLLPGAAIYNNRKIAVESASKSDSE